MLQLTKRTEYGLIALVHLADSEGDFVSAREIGDHYPVPKRLLAEVLKDLGRAGLVESARGATGGYSLSRSPEQVSLGEIIAAVEGRPSLTGCDALGSFKGGSCDVSPVCPIKSPIERVRAGIWELLQRTTLRELANPSQRALVAIETSPLPTGAAAPSPVHASTEPSVEASASSSNHPRPSH